MPKGNEARGLRRRLERIGGSWIDDFVPEKKVDAKVSLSDFEGVLSDFRNKTLTTGDQTKTLTIEDQFVALTTGVKKKAEEKEKEKPDRSVVFLVLGLAAIITVAIWIFFFLCLVIDQQSVADKLLNYAMGITVGLFVSMFAAIGVRYEFVKLG